MTQIDPPDAKPKTFKERLGQPWVGPLISLVVLAVALVSLWYNVATYNRQGDRWAAEDGDMFQLNSSIEEGLTNGSRTGWASFYYAREPMRVQKLEVISPDDAMIALVKGGKTLTPLARSITLDALNGTAPQSPVHAIRCPDFADAKRRSRNGNRIRRNGCRINRRKTYCCQTGQDHDSAGRH